MEADTVAPEDPVAPARSIWTLIGVETLCLLGSEISRFGVSVWIYEQTGSVTALAILLIANIVPGMIAAPFAGSIVDRSSRKRVMIGAATVSLCGSLIVLAGATLGSLSLPIAIGGATLASIAESFQWPALSATVPLMARDDDLPRYNGFLESGRSVSMLAGPPIAGWLFKLAGLPWLIAIELVTFMLATVVVAGMRIPQPAPQPSEAGDEPPVSLLADSAAGFRWILARRPLLKFLLVATFANFFISMAVVLMQPYALSFLGEGEYGITQGMFGAGVIVGGLVYGLFSKRFTNVQQFLASALVLGGVYVAYGFSRSPFSLSGLNFLIAAMMTIGNAAIMTVWQLKVPDHLQGRVLSTMRLVADLTAPLGMMLAGPAADHLAPWVFGRSAAGSVWGSSVTGEMGALFSVMGAILFAGFVLASLVRDIRRVEDLPV